MILKISIHRREKEDAEKRRGDSAEYLLTPKVFLLGLCEALRPLRLCGESIRQRRISG
jgi:hypothetical protein